MMYLSACGWNGAFNIPIMPALKPCKTTLLVLLMSQKPEEQKEIMETEFYLYGWDPSISDPNNIDSRLMLITELNQTGTKMLALRMKLISILLGHSFISDTVVFLVMLSVMLDLILKLL